MHFQRNLCSNIFSRNFAPFNIKFTLKIDRSALITTTPLIGIMSFWTWNFVKYTQWFLSSWIICSPPFNVQAWGMWACSLSSIFFKLQHGWISSKFIKIELQLSNQIKLLRRVSQLTVSPPAVQLCHWLLRHLVSFLSWQVSSVHLPIATRCLPLIARFLMTLNLLSKWLKK